MVDEPIVLDVDGPTEQLVWPFDESESYLDDSGTEVVLNVSQPTLLRFPAAEPTGTAVVIAPGGGFVGLSINSEGVDVARWLAANCGIDAFVLKYRTLPFDPAHPEVLKVEKDEWEAMIAPVRATATADASTAMRYLRANADQLGIDVDRIGFMGFSAGGVLALALALDDDVDEMSRPAFVAPVYPKVFDPSPQRALPDGCGPAFFVCAFDDELGFADDALRAYRWWLDASVPAELHLYAQGGHGFGMRAAGLPRDTWIERFADWYSASGFGRVGAGR